MIILKGDEANMRGKALSENQIILYNSFSKTNINN